MGGEHALSVIDSMYAMGKVTMTALEFSAGDELTNNLRGDNNNKTTRGKGVRHNGEISALQLEENRLVAEIKKTAKTGNEDPE